VEITKTYHSTIQFYYAFKKIFFLNYFNHSNKANFIQNFDDILSAMSDDSNNQVQNIVP